MVGLKNENVMTKKRLKYKFFGLLRSLGLLCKKTKPFQPTIRISKSINADGNKTDHIAFMEAKNLLYGANSLGKNKKMCYYDFQTHTCRCGMNLEKLRAEKKCGNKK
jgi:hypothetical protein